MPIHTISIMVSKNLPDWYKNCNTMREIGEYHKMRESLHAESL